MYKAIVTGALALLLSASAAGQCDLGLWRAEDHSGAMTAVSRGDTMEVVAPRGLTMWYGERLEGDYEIGYRVKFVNAGGEYDRLSDMNCFWGANDPASPDDIFARGAERGGFFPNYKSLTLFYVGYGGNHNTTTRFRIYRGHGPEVPDSIARPLVAEFTDSCHLLKPDHWHHVMIRVCGGVTTYSVDGEELFRFPVGADGADGHFGLRLLENHILLADFRIVRLPRPVAVRRCCFAAVGGGGLLAEDGVGEDSVDC